MTPIKKHYIKIPVNNYWDTCNVSVRYEWGGAWHDEPPPKRHTIIKIDWYKEKEPDYDHRTNYPWKPDIE